MTLTANSRTAFRRRLLRALFLGSGLSATVLCRPALAAPSGAKVAKGSVQISTNGSLTSIQASNNSIINWKLFSIGAGETVQFIQPSSVSRVLNRVTGSQLTSIVGHLEANGLVYIVNPAGVYISNGAIINVGGLYAAAGAMANADFLNGSNHFTNLGGTVSNQGAITGQTVVLAGAQVSNQGQIVSPGGTVTMAAGQEVYVGQTGSPLLVKVTVPLPGAGAGGTVTAGVSNSGDINAAGGQVNLVSGDIYSLAMQESGTITGNTVKLDAGANGTAQVSGTIDASNTTPGATGGSVEVLGHDVALTGTANINASGDAGGGTVLIGGDSHGQGSVPTATTTTMAPQAVIHADAINTGDGGKVVVWSNQATDFAGLITANGGATSGNGGSAEVSGKLNLAFNGQVSLTAAHGSLGTLLLDPADLEIVAGAAGSGAQDSQFVSSGGTVNVTDTPSPYTISVGELALELGNTNVSLNASTVINLNSGATLSAASALNSLTFTAPTINLAAGITTGGAVTFSGSVVLKADTTISASSATFAGTVQTDGTAGWMLGVTTLSGTTWFQGNVGNTTGDALGTLTVTAASIELGDTGTMAVVTKENTASRSVETGAQDYDGPVVLMADTTLTALTTLAPANLASGDGNITFNSTLDSGGGTNWTLTVNGPGATWFQGNVGSILPLGALAIVPQGGDLEVTDLGDGNAMTVTTEENLSARSNQTGAQSYGDNVVLMGDTTLTTTNTTALASLAAGADNITFGGTVLTNGTPWNLAVSAPGVTWFQGNVGATPGDELGLLSISAVGGAFEQTQLGNDSGTFDLVTTDDIDTKSSATGSITFGDPVVLMGDTTITTLTTTTASTLGTTEGNLTFANTLNTNGTAWALTVNAPGITKFEGNVGGATGDALGALTVNPQGGDLEETELGVTPQSGTPSPVTVTTENESDHTAATGAQSFADPIVLMANTTLATGGGDVTAKGTINGAFTLTITAANVAVAPGPGGGNVNITGAIGNTTEPTAMTITGNTIILGAVDVDGDIALTSSSLATGGPSGPQGVIELNGAMNSHGSDISITTTATLPAEATVFAGNGGSLTFTTGGGSFTVAPDTKMSAGGDVTITAGTGAVTVGDISAGGNILVDGASIAIAEPSSGPGVSIVAGGTINFTERPNLPISSFATPNGQAVTLAGVNQIGARAYGAVTLASLYQSGGGPGGADRGFDLTAQGTVINDNSAALAGAVPRELPPGTFPAAYSTDASIFGPGPLAEFHQMGIEVQVPSDSEMQAMLTGSVLLYNVPTVPAEVAERHDFRVDAVRLAPRAAARVLAEFRELFERQVPPSAAVPAHFAMDQRKVDAVGASLTGAVSAYQGGVPGASFDPAAFRAFLNAHKAQQGAAAVAVARLDALFHDMSQMGLTPHEIGESRQHILTLLDLPFGTITAEDWDRLFALAPRAGR